MATATIEQQLEFMREIIRSKGDAAEIRAKFVNAVEKDGVQYAIEWGEEAILDEAIATRWSMIAQHTESVTEMRKALGYAVETVHRELVENYNRPTSTSMLRNGIAVAQREAASRFYRDAKSMLDHVDRIIAELGGDRCVVCGVSFDLPCESDECPCPEAHGPALELGEAATEPCRACVGGQHTKCDGGTCDCTHGVPVQRGTSTREAN